MSNSFPDKPEQTADVEPTDAAEEEYRLAPDDPAPFERPLPVSVNLEDPPPPSGEDQQFSLAELLGLVAAVSVVLSLLSSIARWLGVGKSPAAMAALFASALGVMALLSMVALAFWPNARRIVIVGWWVLVGSYIVTAAAAVLMK